VERARQSADPCPNAERQQLVVDVVDPHGARRQLVLAVLGTTAMQNDPIWWVSFHRRHHKDVDTPEDPHSPRADGLRPAAISTTRLS